MTTTLRRLGAATTLALLAGLVSVAPAGAAASCAPAPVSNNNTVGNQAPTAVDDTATVLAGTSVEIPVLRNDTDPEGDTLALVSAGSSDHGETCTTSTGTIRFRADASRANRTTTFTYGMTDGDRYRSGSVTVSITGLRPATAKLQKRLLLRPNGKVKRPAQVAFTNPNPARLLLIGGPARADDYTFQRSIPAGGTVVVPFRARNLQFITALQSQDEEEFTLVSAGVVNTRNGRVRSQYLGEGYSDFRQGGSARMWARVAR